MLLNLTGGRTNGCERQPKKPDDLTSHTCINLRLATYGGLYAWEFEPAGRGPPRQIIRSLTS